MTGTLGVVLAGGSGERLRDKEPKPFAIVGGESLVARAVRTLEAVCDEVVVTGPASWAARFARTAGGARFVADPEDASGPLAGIVAGLRASAFRRGAVLAVDFPLARSGAMRELLARLTDRDPSTGPRLAIVPAPGGRPQPLFAAYTTEAALRLERSLADGERSIVAALRAIDPWLVPDVELAHLPGGLENFVNLNRPEDRADVEQRLTALTSETAR